MSQLTISPATDAEICELEAKIAWTHANMSDADRRSAVMIMYPALLARIAAQDAARVADERRAARELQEMTALRDLALEFLAKGTARAEALRADLAVARAMLDKIAKHPDSSELIRQAASGMLTPTRATTEGRNE